MAISRSPVKLLFGSGVVSLLGLMFFIKLFGGTATTTYHPPATHELAEARNTLERTGFVHAANTPAADIFMPPFVGNEPIAIGTRLSHRVAEAGEETTVHAAISLQARDAAAANRAPLHIALVIDRSGSMVGDKLTHARSAARHVVENLGPQDKLAIVSYSNDVTVDLALTSAGDGPTADMYTAVNGLFAGGGTNISAGLETGVDLLRASSDARAIRRVILVSDGQANHGITDAPGLGRVASDALEQGISVTAMGVGVDYDELVMHAVANSGAGNYYFIGDEAQIGEVFATELATVKSSVARNTSLRLDLQPGVFVETVHGFPFDRDAAGVRIPLDSFAASERKDILVELRIPANARGHHQLFATNLQYEDVQAENGVVNKQPVRLEFGSRDELDLSVARRLQQIRTLDTFQRAMRMYDRGDRFDAAELLDSQREQNEAFLDDHDLEDPAFERVGTDLRQLAESMRRTERHSYEGKWMVKEKYNYANSAVQNELVF